MYLALVTNRWKSDQSNFTIGSRSVAFNLGPGDLIPSLFAYFKARFTNETNEKEFIQQEYKNMHIYYHNVAAFGTRVNDCSIFNLRHSSPWALLFCVVIPD